MAETRQPTWWETLRQWCGSPRAAVRTVLQLDDSPHSIALGSAIGMWIALTPTPGIQMALVMAVAFATRPFFQWNRPAGLVMCYVSNPLTGVPILWTCYQVGTLFVSSDLTFAQICDLMQPTAERPLVAQLRELLHDLGWPMLIGTLIVSTVSALLTYPVVFWLVAKYQRRHRYEEARDDATAVVVDVAANGSSTAASVSDCTSPSRPPDGRDATSSTGEPPHGVLHADEAPIAIPMHRGSSRASDPCDAVISA